MDRASVMLKNVRELVIPSNKAMKETVQKQEYLAFIKGILNN